MMLKVGLINLRTARRRHSIDQTLALIPSYPGLQERVDPFGEPQQRSASRAVQRPLMTPVQHGVAQLSTPSRRAVLAIGPVGRVMAPCVRLGSVLKRSAPASVKSWFRSRRGA